MTAIEIGLCPVCEGEIRLRRDGTLGKHAPMTAPGAGVCGGYGDQPAKVLPLTFRRWLSTQRNRVARAAARIEGDWVTAEDLSARLAPPQGSPWGSYLAAAAGEYGEITAAGDAA